MRLRRKPWIDEAIHEYDSHIILSGQEQYKGKWRELFVHPERPLYMELGTVRDALLRACPKRIQMLTS